MSVFEEARGILGAPGSYRRLIVDCPHHPGCQKKRNYDTEESRVGGLGDVEPHGVLGCWLSEHANFMSGSEHKAFKPSRTAVSTYVGQQGWLPDP